MHSFTELIEKYNSFFSKVQFTGAPNTLYEPNNYFLKLGGKRLRPVCLLMAKELFEELDVNDYQAATAFELFHNFSLIHDDIMDAAELRRGQATVHTKYGINTAILSGDVMFVKAYQYIAQIKPAEHQQAILDLFNTTAAEVCEGQQLDMDFENQNEVGLADYINMIALKTSVLIAACFKTGGILGNASIGNLEHLYSFGRSLGIAFQVMDDYLDSFGQADKVGKQIGGDIRQNKKTFLLILAQKQANEQQLNQINKLLAIPPAQKTETDVQAMLALYNETGATNATQQLMETYYAEAAKHLEDIAVLSKRKENIKQLMQYLLQRDS
jgi:geranylgeranyl diphosphate synthase, type II